MKYKVSAVSDSEGNLSPLLEEWWTAGGALLWNQYGGLAANSIILDEKEWNDFLSKAQAIHGWRLMPEKADGIDDYGPLTVANCSESEAPDEGVEFICEPSTAKPATEPRVRCCGDCGRHAFEGLAHLWNQDSIVVPKTALNHVLNSLLEAISYAEGQGPNNHRTWQGTLDDFVDSLRRYS
jgi:hypothetical protein